MAIRLFQSFRSTVTAFVPSTWPTGLKLLRDPTSGAPTGIENPNANGADGIWTPIDVTAAQLSAPTPAMVADLNATYRLNVAPFTRYRSNGAQLISYDGQTVQGPDGLFGNITVYAPLTISDPAGLTIQGQVRVIDYPA